MLSSRKYCRLPKTSCRIAHKSEQGTLPQSQPRNHLPPLAILFLLSAHVKEYALLCKRRSTLSCSYIYIVVLLSVHYCINYSCTSSMRNISRRVSCDVTLIGISCISRPTFLIHMHALRANVKPHGKFKGHRSFHFFSATVPAPAQQCSMVSLQYG